MGEIRKRLKNPVSQKRVRMLRAAAAPGPVLILTHDNPDPDAMASGRSLALLFDSWGIPSRLVYCGLIARAENKAMLRLLTPEWHFVPDLNGVNLDDDGMINADAIGLGRFSAVALVDTQPGAGNNSLPEKILPTIVVDHHEPLREVLERVDFVDVQPEAGATVSLVYRYLAASGVLPDSQLATAIFYGIQADTRSLSRGDSPLDQEIYFQMLNLLDRAALNQVEQAGLPRVYFKAFFNGLQATRIYQDIAITYLGEIHRPDFVAEIADLLIRLEETRAVLCFGQHKEMMNISLRTKSGGQDAGLMIQRLVAKLGKAGGHGYTAGGQINLSGMSPQKVAADLEYRFLKMMKISAPGEDLLS